MPEPRVLCIHLPHWPIARRRRRAGGPSGDGPTVVATPGPATRRVVDACERAVAGGVDVGGTLAAARATCPGLTVIDHDPAGDQRALHALARWMTRFTPTVAVGNAQSRAVSARTGDGTPSPVPDGGHARDERSGRHGPALPAPPLLMLDVTGCERAFGGINRLTARVAGAVRAFGLPAGIAVAPTAGAAWAVAVTDGRANRVVTAAELPAAVAPLPVGVLRPDARAAAALAAVGVATVGQLLAIGRDQLKARFGQPLLDRLDDATGATAGPPLLAGVPHEVPCRAGMEFDHAVGSPEGVDAILAELVRRVAADLAGRGCGARQLDLTFTSGYGSDRATATRSVSLSRPNRDARMLLNLARSAVERLVGTGTGFVAVAVAVPRFDRVADAQLGLPGMTATDDERADAAAVDHLLDRIRVRLGDAGVVRPRLVESHLPERAWAADAGHLASPTTVADDDDPLVRPLRLLPTPVEVRVLAEPGEDGRPSGRPRQFAHAGYVHRIAHAVGPERVSGEWWRGHHKTRDYYDVADPAGRRFWLFRVWAWRDRPDGDRNVGARWFLHGTFG